MSVKLGRYKYIATQGPCPEGFHVPLSSEWQALYNIFTGLGFTSSSGSDWSNYLKMPLAGYRGYSNSNVSSVGSYSYYWSSSILSNYPMSLRFSSSYVGTNNVYYHVYGYSIRPFYNEGIAPNGGWQVLYQGSGSAGIYWHKDLGLITASGDGVTWVTIADKNLGATTVYNYGDELSEENCGGYYQWGNNHMFPFIGTVTTSSTQVDASNYGPGNWYDSSIFITRSSSPYRWDTTDNRNLWGGVDGNVWKDVESIGGLPSEYQAVEYIQSTGTQWIDSGLFAYNSYQVETKIEITTTAQEKSIFGSFTNTSASIATYQYYHMTSYQNKWYWGLNGSEGNGGSYGAVGTQYEIVYNNSNNKVVVNNSEIGNTNGTVGYSGSKLGISIRGSTNQRYYGLYKYFYFKIYDKSTNAYVRDFVPCYRKSDGVIGMYDVVNDVFYTNAGTGTFIKGNDTSSGINIGEHQLDEHSMSPQGPAPDGFHVPLDTEWRGLIIIMNGLSLTTGYSWRTNLHMPLAGNRRYSTAGLSGQGGGGFYWSSSPAAYYPNEANYINLSSSDMYGTRKTSRADGFSVRCFKDSYVTPSSSWTVINGTLGGAGIFWNQSEGLISITNGTTGYTMMDKNLGATTVYNYGDTLSQANMGNMYQRGNNYGFPSTGSVTTSSTQVNAQNYGPGNYYNSSIFITGNNDWSSVHNDDLWGGVSQPECKQYYSFNLLNEYIGEYHECNVNTMGPCPDGFHVPLNTEWQAVYDIWTNLGGLGTDGTNFGIALKLPVAGYRSRLDSNIANKGSYGYYWSSAPHNADYAYRLQLNSSNIYPQVDGSRTAGGSIRPFKNFPVIPDSSWTKLYGTSIESGGIFWSSTDGLISLSSNGTNWITMQDKNLGATQVWNSGDTLSESNCGKYYQRGNNHGFSFTGTVTTSSTQVDASTYGPFTEYYNSDTFITRSSSPYDWSSVRNDNLWGGVSGNTRNCSLGGGSGFPTTVVCDFRAGAPGELTTLAQVKNPGDFIAQRGSSEIVDGADGSVRIRISSTDYFAQVCLGGCLFYNSTITNLGYSNGMPDRASGKQNLIKKAYIRIKSSYGSGSGYSVHGQNGVVMYFANKQVSSNIYGSDVCCAGFPFSRGSDSGTYIWGPLDSNVQFLALPSTANVGAGVRCTTYINQGVSCADSRVTLETRGTGPSDFHYWLIVEKTGNEYDLGLCSDLGWAQVIVTCGDWWMSGSYRDIDEIYMEVFDDWYIDANGNITDTKPW